MRKVDGVEGFESADEGAEDRGDFTRLARERGEVVILCFGDVETGIAYIFGIW